MSAYPVPQPRSRHSHSCSSQSLRATEVLLYNPNHPVVFIDPSLGREAQTMCLRMGEVTAEIVKGPGPAWRARSSSQQEAFADEGSADGSAASHGQHMSC